MLFANNHKETKGLWLFPIGCNLLELSFDKIQTAMNVNMKAVKKLELQKRDWLPRWRRRMTLPGLWPIRSQNSLVLRASRHSASWLQQPIRCRVYSARQKCPARSSLCISLYSRSCKIARFLHRVTNFAKYRKKYLHHMKQDFVYLLGHVSAKLS